MVSGNKDDSNSGVYIRRAVLSDAGDLTRIHTQLSSYYWTLQLPYPDPKVWEDRLSNQDNSCILVAESDSKVVGVVGLNWENNPRIRHVGHIGMSVDEGCRGQGIGQDLLDEMITVSNDWLGISRIALEVFVDNEAAIKLYKKFGFEIEGTLKASALREGKLVDAYVMARLKR